MAVINLNDLFPEPADGSTRGPLPKQQTFMNAVLDQKGPAYCLYSGGVGSGKTLIGCIITITLAVLYPGDYLVCRLYNPELKLTTYKTFLDICPKELIVEHRVADQIVRIKSQGGKISNVIFRGLEEPDKHRSLNLNAAYIDEASQVAEEAFSLLQTRLRGAHVRKIYATTNPNGHSWLYRYWIKRDWPTEKAKRNFLHVSAPSTENVHLPTDYVDNMLSSWTKERIDREVMGSWDAFAGQIYSEFSRNLHVVKPFKIPEEWTRFGGLDHGFTNPACLLWCAMDYDSNIYVYREFYKPGWVIQEVCKGNPKTGEPGIIAMNGKDKLDGIWIDPSTQAKRDANGSHYDTYLEHLPKSWSMIPANNAVSAGIDRVKELLKPNPVTGQPRLFIFENCENLIEEITQYRWKERPATAASSQNEPEEPVKKDDHSVDALRYAIMSRPEEPKKADQSAKKRQAATLEGAVLRELHELKSGGGGYKDPFGEAYIREPDWDSY